MKRAVLLIVGVMLIAGLAMAKKINLGYEPEGFDELAKEKGVFKTTLIRPDADFSRYTKLNPRKVMLVVRESVPKSQEKETGSLLGSRSRTIVMPDFEELARLKEIIGESIDTQLKNSTDCELVHDSGPGTLMLRTAVTDVLFDEVSGSKSSNGEPVPILKQGTIVFDLIDGETGVIQARFGERRKCEPAKASEITEPWPNVVDWAELAAADLGRELERMRSQSSAG
jgi:hypothetical protein